MNRYWIVLILSGLFETIWAIGLKYSDGFSKLYPSSIVILAMLISVLGLSYAMKTIPVSIAYVVWTSIGAIGTVIAGIVLFKEPISIIKIILLSIIIFSIIGLRLVDK